MFFVTLFDSNKKIEKTKKLNKTGFGKLLKIGVSATPEKTGVAHHREIIVC